MFAYVFRREGGWRSEAKGEGDRERERGRRRERPEKEGGGGRKTEGSPREEGELNVISVHTTHGVFFSSSEL